MGLLDKAKAAANEIASKADTALAGAGVAGPSGSRDADRYFRDLGVLAYMEADGRPTSAADRERVMGALRDLESRGAIGPLNLQTAPPPPPGAAPPPAGGPVPPAPGAVTPPPESTPKAPPPPPPSW